MKNKRLLGVVLFMVMATNSFPTINVIAESQSFEFLEFYDIEPQADIIEWRYKVENGKLYKRLYNYSKEKWVGEWILIP